ncbi:MAG: hypothetical protein COV45_03680 [Deltaproteobacteria bacterium CG11_big_fil_rev_8_21_14_0_20_47_16]|nr:MAG: hypothetical protein COV45_03680 [Deltaproteobacteria bacterium CG11_big_fil_rev_8_21_14_0_20_47_16]
MAQHVLKLATLISTALLSMCCSGQKAQQQKVLKIAYVAKLKGESFHDGIANGVRKEMAKDGIQVDIISGSSQQDVETQKQALKDIASSKEYDGVMLAPNDSEALVSYMEAIDKAGMPFILIDTPLSDTATSRSFKNDCGFVGTDNVYAGKLAAQYIIEHVSSGSVFLMRGNHKHQSSIDRENGFVSEMSQHKNIHLIGFVQGWWEEESAHTEFSSFVRSKKQPIDAIFAYNDPMALGISRYYSEHPSLKRPIIVGVDGTLVGQKGLLLQKIDASIVQAPEVMGKIGLDNLIECIQRKHERTNTLTPVTLLKSTTTLEGNSE